MENCSLHNLTMLNKHSCKPYVYVKAYYYVETCLLLCMKSRGENNLPCSIKYARRSVHDTYDTLLLCSFVGMMVRCTR